MRRFRTEVNGREVSGWRRLALGAGAIIGAALVAGIFSAALALLPALLIFGLASLLGLAIGFGTIWLVCACLIALALILD